MNYAILRKTARDTLLIFILVVLGILVFECFFLRAVREFSEEGKGTLLRLPTVGRFLRTLVGADFGAELTPTSLATIGFVHPIVLVLTWGMLITHCTRVLSGETDRGTADLVLSLPVSRSSYYFSVTLAWLLMGIPIAFAPICGLTIGERIFPLWEPLDLVRLRVITLNFAALYLGVGGVAMFVAAHNNYRAPAIAILIAGLLASMLVNFLAGILETSAFGAAPARRDIIHTVKYLGILQYYQPLPILRSGEIPWHNIGTLVGIGSLAWLVGLFRFLRRDVPAA